MVALPNQYVSAASAILAVSIAEFLLTVAGGGAIFSQWRMRVMKYLMPRARLV
jgi:hypothetical protein